MVTLGACRPTGVQGEEVERRGQGRGQLSGHLCRGWVLCGERHRVLGSARGLCGHLMLTANGLLCNWW